MDILNIRYIIEVMDNMDIIDIIDIIDILDIMIITAGLAMTGAVSAILKCVHSWGIWKELRLFTLFFLYRPFPST